MSLYILGNCAPELLGIKEIVKRDAQAVTNQLDSDNTWIMAIAVNDVFQGRRRNASLPRQGVNVVTVRCTELLNTQRYQFPRIHIHTP